MPKWHFYHTTQYTIHVLISFITKAYRTCDWLSFIWILRWDLIIGKSKISISIWAESLSDVKVLTMTSIIKVWSNNIYQRHGLVHFLYINVILKIPIFNFWELLRKWRSPSRNTNKYRKTISPLRNIYMVFSAC